VKLLAVGMAVDEGKGFTAKGEAAVGSAAAAEEEEGVGMASFDSTVELNGWGVNFWAAVALGERVAEQAAAAERSSARRWARMRSSFSALRFALKSLPSSTAAASAVWAAASSNGSFNNDDDDDDDNGDDDDGDDGGDDDDGASAFEIFALVGPVCGGSTDGDADDGGDDAVGGVTAAPAAEAWRRRLE
jgi:hypothetical protein